MLDTDIYKIKELCDIDFYTFKHANISSLSGIKVDEFVLEDNYGNENVLKHSRSDTLDIEQLPEFSGILVDLDIVIYLLNMHKIKGRIILTNLYKLLAFITKAMPITDNYKLYYNAYDTTYQNTLDTSNEENQYTNVLTNDYGLKTKD